MVSVNLPAGTTGTVAHVDETGLRVADHPTHREVHEAKARGDTSLGKETFDRLWAQYRAILTMGDSQSPARVHPTTGGRIAQTEPRQLLNRLSSYEQDVLRFTTDFSVPFDNNQTG